MALFDVRVYLWAIPATQAARWDVGLWDAAAWDAAAPTRNDVTADTLSVDTQRGRQNPRERFQAGTASLELFNPSGAWSPWLSEPAQGGAYVDLDAGVPLEVTWTDPAGAEVYLFTGRAEECADHFTPRAPRSSTPERSYVTFHAADGFATLARAQPATRATAAGDRDWGGERVTRHLDAAGWSYGRRIDPGTARLQGTTFSRSTLEDLYLTADSEPRAELFCDAGGALVYWDADRPGQDPRQAVPQVYLTDRPQDPLPADMPPGVPVVGYAQVALAADRAQIVNRASVAAGGLTEQVAEDPASQTEFGLCTWQRHDLIYMDNFIGARIAQATVDDFAHASKQIQSVTLDLGNPQSWASTPAARAALCALELCDRLRLVRHYQSGQVLDVELPVAGITHRVTPDAWDLVLATGRLLRRIPVVSRWDRVDWDSGAVWDH